MTPSDAKSLFDGAPTLSVSFNHYLDAWTVVYCPPFENTIMMRTAPKLTGPWSHPIAIHTAHRGDAIGADDAVHHPEFEEDDGRVQHITYSRPTDA